MEIVVPCLSRQSSIFCVPLAFYAPQPAVAYAVARSRTGPHGSGSLGQSSYWDTIGMVANTELALPEFRTLEAVVVKEF